MAKKLKLWFDFALAEKLAQNTLKVSKEFKHTLFLNHIKTSIENQELKSRIETFADAFFIAFNKNYELGCKALLQTVGPENLKETGMFTEYYWLMPFAKFVEKYGLNNYDLSMHAVTEITKRNTCEFTIRPFIENYPEKTLNQMLVWSKHENFHLRRLSSEGIRPRLPWATKLNEFVNDPTPIIPILENLKNDPIKYVQRSVANCINDILKDNEAFAKELLQNWYYSSNDKATRWIIKHAVRNYRKNGINWALDICK